MLIYEGTKEGFLNDVGAGLLVGKLEENLYARMKRRSGEAEIRSWKNSLTHMYVILNDPGIPDDSGIAIEYNIPQTSKRVDFLISGYDKNGNGNVVIIELKQWDKISAVQGEDGLVSTYTGGAFRQVVHPSYQAWSYSRMIYDYNQSVQDGDIQLFPCAYLHNYDRQEKDPLDEEQYETYLDDAPAFTAGQTLDLKDFIKKRVVKGDNEALLYSIDHGRIKPSKSLQDCIAQMVQGNPEFVLLDEQKVIYEDILKASRQSFEDSKKRVIIVRGGPGTGKTVVAVNLLSQLTQDGQFCQYVSKNSAPRNVYLKKLKGKVRKSSVDNMFKGSGNYVDAGENAVDTVLADEAHRLNKKSGMYHNGGENQIKEIIHAAKCSVFFIDEEQRVTLNDIGSVEEIEKWAKKNEAEVSILELTSQFRCNGSDGYLSWIDNVLEIRETANWDLEKIDFDFRVMDSPQDLYELILQKNEESNNRARLLAGYCWEWPKEGKSDPEYHDIKIGDFEISWNLYNRKTYAIDEDSVYEAGCIHTVQGLEFDYAGVIIGDDLRYENGKIVTDPGKRAHSDRSLSGIGKMRKEDPDKARQAADEIIKNTYRTLMTRGMKGCYVYCTDQNLAEHLRECSSDFVKE